jgi:hypothetical protein
LIEKEGWEWDEPEFPKEWACPLTPEQLLQIINVLSKQQGMEEIRLVLYSPQGDSQFLKVDSPEFKSMLQESLAKIPLGLLGFEITDESVQAKSSLFP